MSAPLDFVVLDVETTGLDPTKGDEVIEIAAQKIHGRDVVGEFVSLLKTTRLIPPEATKIHGITQEDINLNGKNAVDIIPELVTFIGEAVIIGRNVQFDLGFINEHLRRLDKPILTNQAIDTVE